VLELIGGIVLGALFGYFAMATFVMGAFSTDRRWVPFAASAFFTACAVALFVFALGHVDVDVHGG
jgi:hypothetical protein